MTPLLPSVDRAEPSRGGAGAAVVEPGGTLSREDLLRDVLGLRGRVPRGGTAVVASGRASLVAAALVALEGWAGQVHLRGDVEAGPVPDGAVVVADDPEADLAVGAQATAPPVDLPGAVTTSWVLHTSGTTGVPKAVRHTLASLSRTVRAAPEASPPTWGLLYDPTRMAGLQVVLHALANRCPLVDARVDGGMPARVQVLLRHDVEAVSATPTTWRQVLQVRDAERLALRQITLGGEIADQTVLDALRRAFPAARITHVFASTETGAAFSVSDGRAGFPADHLTVAPRGVRLEVRDGVLHVHSPGVSTAGPDGFASTGDLVEVSGDRVLFLGRQSGVVNVAGAKVWPEQVERVLRSHEDVVDAVVTARRSALSGSLLVATVVPSPGSTRQELPAVLRAFCRARLQPAEVPAVVRVADELPVSAAGKAQR